MCRHAGAPESSSSLNVNGRELLPTNVVPRHYDLTLEPNFTNFTFDGTVVVDLDVAEDSKSISLHTLELEIHSVKISSDGKVIRYAEAPLFLPLASRASVAQRTHTHWPMQLFTSGFV